MLFENEKFEMCEINNVVHYAPKGQTLYKYSPKLPTHELMCFKEGSVSLCFHGKVLEVHAGDVVYLPKGIEGGEYSMRAAVPFSLYNIYFQTESPMPKEAVHIKGEGGALLGLYEKIYRVWREKQRGYYLKAMQEVYRILHHIHLLKARYAPSSSLARLDKAEAYIAEHYCDANFDYEMLCRSTGLSYSYFKKLFIDRYGTSPVKYVTARRVTRAAELLETERFSVTEVASLCGFENVYYFSSVFKRYKGVSPKFFVKSK